PGQRYTAVMAIALTAALLIFGIPRGSSASLPAISAPRQRPAPVSASTTTPPTTLSVPGPPEAAPPAPAVAPLVPPVVVPAAAGRLARSIVTSDRVGPAAVKSLVAPRPLLALGRCIAPGGLTAALVPSRLVNTGAGRGRGW